MENYLDVNMLKYKKYRTLFRTDPYNSAIYQYKMRKYGNRIVDALNTSAHTGGASIQSIGDTYLTNLDIYNRIQHVNKLLAEIRTDIHHKKVNHECVEDHATFMRASDDFLKSIDARQDAEIALVADVAAKVKTVDANASALQKIIGL